ncbi:MAG: hypothetical protein HKN74_04460 [Acidimicrobiia bacterium]|nr:hypothetical protein [Acidimicrobiia bacterium]MBT8216093.1 hypothetical protein [Acidimicrobiia bacterium]NNF09518.1 hypothetical protein [Acidimicrobiia bacterium]NNL71018.1 hypothetical protein [Acidimicrobiia bacterium]
MIERVLIVAAVAAGALVVAWLLRVRARRGVAVVDVSGLTAGPAVVVFTKDDCANCARTLERIGALGLPIRQIRAEDDPEALRSRGITGVPVTVFVDSAGRSRRQFAGLPPARLLRRAAASMS